MPYTTVKALFTAICDAIRAKDGTTELISHQDIPSRISSLSAKLQQKSVSPTETAQTVSPDSGYDGLSSVSVEAISKTYVGSGVTKKAAATYTPGTSDQTIESGQYLSGAQTIKGDSNLAAGNIKKGVSIFGVTGTNEANLQSRTATPSETAQTISPDSGYDGLSSVSVGAISKTYIGSGISKKASATYTPGTSDQTISSGIYLSGTQTIKGDANLIAGNIKSGVSIFGVSGTMSGGDNTMNCEACIIDATNPVVDFKGTGGTIKAWGYAKGTTSMYQTPSYGFIGTQYKKTSSYGSDTTTNMTLSVDSSGNLSGLPSGLASGTLLITRGI